MTRVSKSVLSAVLLAVSVTALVRADADGSAATDIGSVKDLIERGLYTDALRVLTRMSERPEGLSIDGRYQLAVCHARLGNTKAAEASLEAVLQGQPSHLPALHLKAYLQFSAGRYRDSLEWAEKFLRLHPDGGETRKVSGLSRFMLGDKQGAEADLEVAVRQLPADFDAHYYLGRVYFEQSKVSPALQSLRRAVAIQSDSVKARNHLGQALEGLARFEEAAEAYREAIELESSGSERSEWPYYNLGALLLADGDVEGAITLLEKALDRNPSSAQVRTKLGAALSAASRFAEAASQLRVAVRAAPEHAEARFQLGRVLMRLGETDEARVQLQEFQRLRGR